MKKENKYTYIKVHKDLTKQLDSKFEGRTTFNVMHIPNGVEIGNKDLSGGIINPILMYEDKYNKNMMTAQYNKEYLEDNSITVNLKNNGEIEKIKVDVDVLADKIRTVNHVYLKNKREESHKEKVEKEKKFGFTNSDKTHEHTV